MKTQLGNNKASLSNDFVQIQNNGAAAIAQGAPAIYEMDGTDDGLSAENASDSTAGKASSFLAGVNPDPTAIAVGDYGRVQVRGFIDNLKLIRATRAASTDTYATLAAVAIGDELIVNTVGNGFSRDAAGAATAQLAAIVAVGTLASRASSASTTSDSGTEVTALIDAFLRIM